MESIRYLDERLVIEYERYVLSAKIIRGTREIPHPSIDTVALLKAFEKNEPYIQCLKDNHNNFFSVTEYIGYRSITKHMSDFENYVQNKEYDISFYRRIARKTYESIAGKYTQDIPSRLALIEIMEEQCAVEDAENLEIAKEKYNSALKYKPDEREAGF